MENQVTVMKSEELQLMEARANAEFAVTAAGQLMKSFETTQRIGTMFSKSSIVPKEYQGNVANCAIAVDMAMHLGKGISPLTVMQQLTIVQGRPTWSAQFLISCINTCGKFSTIRYEEKNLGKIGKTGVNKYVYENGKGTQKLVMTEEYADVDNLSCIAYAYDNATGEKLNSIEITIKMAMAEGWYAKSGSKWQSMPQQMLRYRAAAFWQRAYAPEVGMGFYTTEEVQDIAPAGFSYTEIKEAEAKTPVELAMEEMKKKRKKADAPIAPVVTEPQPQGNPVIYPEPQGEKEASEAQTRGTQVNVPPTPFDEPETAKNAENGNPKAGRTLV